MAPIVAHHRRRRRRPRTPRSDRVALPTSTAQPARTGWPGRRRSARRRARAESGRLTAVEPEPSAAPATAAPSRAGRSGRGGAAGGRTSRPAPRAAPPSPAQAERQLRTRERPAARDLLRAEHLVRAEPAQLARERPRGASSRTASSAASRGATRPARAAAAAEVRPTGETVEMKVAVVSDIHGNRQALEAVLEAIDASECEELWCLGDLVGYGADPEAVRRAGPPPRGDLPGREPRPRRDRGARSGRVLPRGGAGRPTGRGRRSPTTTRASCSRCSRATSRRSVGLYHASPRDPVWEYVLSPLQAELCLDVQPHQWA